MEDFVTFEIALKLKEKGFRERCLLHYETTGGFYSNSIDTYDRPNQELDYSDFLKCFNEGNSIGLIDAPTISQVLKWLRDQEISVEPLSTPYNDWECLVKNKGSIVTIIISDKYKTYEQVAIAGIEDVLDKLI